MIGAVIVFWNRTRIYKALGVEDISFVRLSVKDFWNRGWRSEVDHFQICIFCILGQDEKSEEEDRLEGLLPGQGSQYSLFVRVGYGDNEPQTTRVVSGSRMNSNTRVYFRQAFQFNVDDPSFGTPAPLYITVQSQQVVSCTEIARFVLDGRSIKRLLQNYRHSERRDKQQKQHLYTRQLAAMSSGRISKEDERTMASELHFDTHSLIGGGSIIFAIAPMETFVYDAQ